ncbi:SDR family NAD(P)-dependent oxidoreductase [Natrononativus amylolyticus]|uniref:SDR family NAD(P)-dependent oxidoreductase n=1 Tax=Natrononativus amylolyticus TaxID=2963434 RepID=UPI0020CEB4E0|nr:SDR family oxidoreductase [Natrononativus amylolyticus]
MDLQLEGQTAIVIGGTTGIGRGITERLYEEGVNVVPTSRTEKSVEEAARAVECPIVHPTDITCQDDIESLLETTTAQIGAVNILINSSGLIQEATSPEEMSIEQWDTIIETNLYGPFLASKMVPPYMDGENKNILNVSSMVEEVPLKGMSAYVTSKFGVKGLTKNLALDYANDDIRVNAIAPGNVVTRQNEDVLTKDTVQDLILDRTPMGRYANVEEIADPAAFLVSPRASYATGETFVVDGGFTLK